ncbi:MAG: hypothetical protein LBM98_08990 [Oscillospiraceae bacterium]|nr:hypothetical protein [Oscillospiraceae bacterium]
MNSTAGGEILKTLQTRAGAYVPEWRFRAGEAEPGAALAALFAELFGQTLERYERLPEKYYIEFLNLLGVGRRSPKCSSGYVRFFTNGADINPVNVPATTEVFASGGDGNIVFSTEYAIDATSATLSEIFYADRDTIERLDLQEPKAFFETSGNNLQSRYFSLSNNSVLKLSGNCAIKIKLRQRGVFPASLVAETLSDPMNALWQYYSGGEFVRFNSVTQSGGLITLTNSTARTLEADANGRVSVYCEFHRGANIEGSIVLSDAAVTLEPLSPFEADALAYDSVPIQSSSGGYCFGRRPTEYDTFYIRSDAAFSKAGADVVCVLDIASVIVDYKEPEAPLEFKKRVIEKKRVEKLPPDDVFIDDVIWEFYNGTGWAHLDVRGDINPFKADITRRYELRFTVPADITAVQVNASEGYYIRARVTRVENFLSVRPRLLLPFVTSVLCDFRYIKFQAAEYISATNNLETTELENAYGKGGLDFKIYAPAVTDKPAMYLGFNGALAGQPLSLYFELVGGGADADGLLTVETSNALRTETIRLIDETRGLRKSGLVLLYFNRPTIETRLFGLNRHWLKLSLNGNDGNSEKPRVVAGLYTNTVRAVQTRAAGEQIFSTGLQNVTREFELFEKPVQSCKVEISGNAVREWTRVEALTQAGADEEVYELDGERGLLRFGDGVFGKAPPPGVHNIQVRYTYGGGTSGNIAPGAVNALLQSVPRISGLVNVTPMTGGADAPPPERTGKNRFRHRFVPVSTRDFEEIVLENFVRVTSVKCRTGLDDNGEKALGRVTVVVATDDGDNAGLCGEIYAYLAERCECTLVPRLRVIPALELSVRFELCAVPLEPSGAVEISLRLHKLLNTLIDDKRKTLGIGGIITLAEVTDAVLCDENVSAIDSLFAEGVYIKDGAARYAALDDFALPFVIMRSGAHSVRIKV